MISKNAEALDFLLKHEADIHKNCVVDPRISTKKMKPMNYFAKMLRLKGIQEGDDEILKLILKYNIKIQEGDELDGIYR